MAGEGSNKFPFPIISYFLIQKIPFGDQKIQSPRIELYHRNACPRAFGSLGLWASGSLGLWVFRFIFGSKKFAMWHPKNSILLPPKFLIPKNRTVPQKCFSFSLSLSLPPFLSLSLSHSLSLPLSLSHICIPLLSFDKP